MEKIASRSYAHPFDRPVDGPADQHGVSPSPDAIGGYYGMGWYQYYEDRNTGERYRVHCSDGVNGGKDAFDDKLLPWIEACYRAIVKRTKDEVKRGAPEVRISTAEWHIMLGRIHEGWLDQQPGQKYTSGDRSVREGCIGCCIGVPVIVDPDMEPRLPDPPVELS